MNEPSGVTVTTRRPITHPEWCDQSRCLTVPSGPDGAPTTFHVSRADCWVTDECGLNLEVIRNDDPYDDRGPVGDPQITLVTEALPGVRDGDLLFTVDETVDLIARLQAMVDLARAGR